MPSYLQTSPVTYLFLSDLMDIIEAISKKIIEASTTLSDDKLKSLTNAIEMEENENARWALTQILENYNVAHKTRFPLCDDTGIPHVIIELGSNREISGGLLNQIHEGIALGLNNLPARPMAVMGDDTACVICGYETDGIRIYFPETRETTVVDTRTAEGYFLNNDLIGIFN